MAAVKVNRLKNPVKLSRICGGFWLCLRNNHNAVDITEFSEEPKYPPILDMSRKARNERTKEAWHDKVTKLPTVEQKFMELNMPKYYGYWSCHLRDKKPELNGLPFLKYATRTHTVNALPDNYYFDVKADSEKIAGELQDQVEALIELNFKTPLNRKASSIDSNTHNFLLGLHRILNGTLASVDHIRDSIVDVKPRVEAFWFLGGVQPDKMLKKIRRNDKNSKDREHDLIDRPMQGFSTPSLGIRVHQGLPEVVPMDHELSTSPVSVENLDPRAYGYRFHHKSATITAGFWPGETREYCQLWLHCRQFAEKASSYMGHSYYLDYIHQKMIIASFTQALAHACYLGFGPVTELTYPIVQQSVLSDGKKWNFSVYQLNTCALHSKHAYENLVNNILWLNDEQLLFEAVDDTGVKGFNIEVLANLVAMYLKKGIERENATPYLAPFKYLAKHPASEEYRQNFHHSLLQYVFSGRPKHRLKPELYNWERIYKVTFKTRPFEPPRRFFEPHFNQKDPGNQRLDDYVPVYIPKALRTNRKLKYKPKIDSELLFKYDERYRH